MIEYLSHRELQSPPRSQAVRMLRAALAGVGWFFAGIALIVVLILLWLPMPALAGVVMLVALMLMAMLGNHLAVVRRQVAAAVLGYLSSAVVMRLPIPPYLRICAEAERGAVRRRLQRLAGRLEGGDTIGLGVGEVLGELPARSIDRVRVAEGTATLDRALPELVAAEQRGASLGAELRQLFVYVAILYVAAHAIVSILMIYVVPKYAEIFRDFNTKLPASTQALVDFAYRTWGGFLFISVLMIPVLMLVLMRATRGLFISRPMGLGATHLFDGLLWRLPIAGRLIRSGASADVSKSLADALEAGRPLPEAIEAASSLDLNRVLSRRLVDMHNRVIAGEPLGAAARDSRLPPLMAAAFAMGVGTADLAGSLGFAGRAYAAQTHRLLALLRATVPVLVTLVLGAVIGFIAVALISPMASLMQAISIQVHP